MLSRKKSPERRKAIGANQGEERKLHEQRSNQIIRYPRKAVNGVNAVIDYQLYLVYINYFFYREKGVTVSYIK